MVEEEDKTRRKMRRDSGWFRNEAMLPVMTLSKCASRPSTVLHSGRCLIVTALKTKELSDLGR